MRVLKLLALVGVSLLAGCSTVSVTTDYDPSASFAKYRTYRLAPAAHGQTLGPISEATLRAALRRDLGARGIVEVTSGKADLAVVRHVFVREKVDVNQFTDWGYGGAGWPYQYGTYGIWVGAPRTFVDVQRFSEGTLVLDFVDTRTQRLVFRGTAKAVVGGAKSNARAIDEAVAKIVAQFPSGATR